MVESCEKCIEFIAVEGNEGLVECTKCEKIYEAPTEYRRTN